MDNMMTLDLDCPQDQRYLYTDILLPQDSFDWWKQAAARFWERKLKTGKGFDESLYQKYMNWSLGDKQFALYTMYAYANFTIPKKFTCVFDMRNPMRFEECELTLKISAYEAMFCTNDVDAGHKHLQVFETKQSIPKLVMEMKATHGQYVYDPKALKIGLCMIEDYESIKEGVMRSR